MIDAIERNTPRGSYEIIVVDEASTDRSTNTLPSSVRVFKPAERGRKGSIWSRNMGASLAKGEHLVFMDGHVYPQKKNWLIPQMSNWLATDGVFVTPGISSYYRQGGEPSYGAELPNVDLNIGYRQVSPLSGGEVPAFSGACVAMSRRTFYEAGMWDPGLKLWGMEDSELSLRAWLLGYRIVCATDSIVAHVFAEKAIAGANRPFPSRGLEYRFNQLRTAHLHLDSGRLEKVRQHVFSEDPGNAKRAEQLLLSSQEYRDRKQWVDSRRKRDIHWYANKFAMNW